MGGTGKFAVGTTGRLPTFVWLVALVLVGATACSTDEDQASTTQGSSSSSASAADDGKTTEADEGEDLESLSSDELLDRGIAGDTVVKCDFSRGDVEGTIYFGGVEQQRFDGVNANGVPSHIVNHEGQAHAWNDAQSEGARYPRPEEVSWLVADDPADMRAHSSNCVPHSDLSVFDLPDGVTFTDLPTQ